MNIPIEDLYLNKMTGDLVWLNDGMTSPRVYSNRINGWVKYWCDEAALIPVSELSDKE